MDLNSAIFSAPPFDLQWTLESWGEGNPKRRTREVQEMELVEEAEEGGEGHSCDKEVRRKDVASVGLRGK